MKIMITSISGTTYKQTLTANDVAKVDLGDTIGIPAFTTVNLEDEVSSPASAEALIAIMPRDPATRRWNASCRLYSVLRLRRGWGRHALRGGCLRH